MLTILSPLFGMGLLSTCQTIVLSPHFEFRLLQQSPIIFPDLFIHSPNDTLCMAIRTEF